MNNPDPATIKSLFDQYRGGEYQALLERTQDLLETWPGEAVLHSLAGAAALELHDYEEAVRSYQAALELRPDLAKAHNSLGIAYLRLGRLEDAATSFHHALRHDSQLAQAWFNLGLVHENHNRPAQAADCYRQATRINPVYHQALCALAKVLWELRLPEQVEDCFEKAIAIDANYLPAQLGLLGFLEQANRHEPLRRAVARARQALGEHEIVRLFEGILAAIDGEHEHARALLEAFSIAPADTLQQHSERMRLARLARLCERLGDPDATLKYARNANDLSRQLSAGKGIDKSRFLRRVENRRRYFTAANLERWSQFAAAGERAGPVFIIGFPRSGSTLLDTLLRGHPALRVVEETDAVATMVNRLAGPTDARLDSMGELSGQEIEMLRLAYFKALARHLPAMEGLLPIDRFALNTVYAGEIYRVFPQARFILLLRHPADCVLSCFLQTFYETSANASFFTLEDSAHLYHRVFDLWRQYTDLLPLKVLQVKYEDLIADTEPTCRRILKFLDMPWHPDILAHERSARERPLIGTASYDQVTRPIYRAAQGRWRRYQTAMQPVLPALQPWINYFGY